MDSIKELYSKNVNIMEYFRENTSTKDSNSIDAVLCAYDYQAGSYMKNYYSNEVIKNVYLYQGNPIDLTSGEYTRLAAKCMSNEFNKLSFQTMLEVGIVEATTICDILEGLSEDKQAWGIELSLSRLFYAQKFMEQKSKNINLALGNMFSLPFADNSFDLVFTYYCIAESRGKEKSAIEEMLRVSKDYLILVESSYELGNEETKERIDKLKYIKGLKETLKEVDADVIEHKLFDIFTYNNNSAITILKKRNSNKQSESDVTYACPVCKKKLINHQGNLFCNNCFSLYPIINNIPCLLKENGILSSKYLEF